MSVSHRGAGAPAALAGIISWRAKSWRLAHRALETVDFDVGALLAASAAQRGILSLLHGFIGNSFQRHKLVKNYSITKGVPPMMVRLAIVATAAATMLAAAPAEAAVGIGWGPEDHGVRTVVVNGRVLSLPRDEAVYLRTGNYHRSYRHDRILLDR